MFTIRPTYHADTNLDVQSLRWLYAPSLASLIKT